jgi:hypothetical protein
MVSGFEAFGIGLLLVPDDDERLRCLKGFSRFSMKPWTETYGSSLEHEPESSVSERKDPVRRREVGVIGRFSKQEDIFSLAGNDLGWGSGSEAER